MEKDKYEILLSELAALLKKKNETIEFQGYEIERLKKRLEAAENSVKNSGKPQNIERR